MSWNFRKVGIDKELLKAAVRAEHAPDSIKDEVCTRIDGCSVHTDGTQVIYVATHGHLDTVVDRPFYGVSDIKISVFPIPFINTPA